MGQHNPIPFFSIVIPTLNEEQYLPRLLLDLSNETFQDFEVIIVDAQSDDLTTLKAQQFEKKFDRFTILDSASKNVSHQRNIGAQKALADWLIFLDADNQLPNDFLQRIKHLTEAQKPDFLSTWFEPDSEDIKYKAIATLSNLAIEIYKNTQSPLLREAFVCANKKAFLHLGGFDETIPIREGTDLLKRAYAYKMSFLFYRDPKFIYSYRRLRKQGILKAFRNTVIIEIARLINFKISPNTSKFLYPMDGGSYFEISTQNRVWNKKFSHKVRKLPKFESKGSNHDFLADVLRRIFKPL